MAIFQVLAVNVCKCVNLNETVEVDLFRPLAELHSNEPLCYCTTRRSDRLCLRGFFFPTSRVFCRYFDNETCIDDISPLLITSEKSTLRMAEFLCKGYRDICHARDILHNTNLLVSLI